MVVGVHGRGGLRGGRVIRPADKETDLDIVYDSVIIQPRKIMALIVLDPTQKRISCRVRRDPNSAQVRNFISCFYTLHDKPGVIGEKMNFIQSNTAVVTSSLI